MQATRALFKQRQPMIRFLGKRALPKKIDHTPHVHPAAPPSSSLPDSFVFYRNRVTQHGPLGPKNPPSSSSSSSTSSPSSSQPPRSAEGYDWSANSAASSSYFVGGRVGGRSGREFGSVQPAKGEYFDVDELPERFRRRKWRVEDIEAVESGGASLWG